MWFLSVLRLFFAMLLPLSELKPGDQGIIRELPKGQVIANLLREMGVLPGTEVTFERRAPLGDPLEVRIRSYSLSLRAVDAAEIFVEASHS